MYGWFDPKLWLVKKNLFFFFHFEISFRLWLLVNVQSNIINHVLISFQNLSLKFQPIKCNYTITQWKTLLIQIMSYKYLRNNIVYWFLFYLTKYIIWNGKTVIENSLNYKNLTNLSEPARFSFYRVSLPLTRERI